MRNLVLLSGVACLCTSGWVIAADDTATTSPAEFVEKAAQDGMTEVELGKVAQQKGQSANVKSFGARMVKDHGKANVELASIAKPKNLRVPTKLDAEHRAMVEELSGKSGAEFDTTYAEHMSQDHSKAIELFTDASHGSDTDLAAFAKKTLPTLQEHKRMADSLAFGKHGASAADEGAAR